MLGFNKAFGEGWGDSRQIGIAEAILCSIAITRGILGYVNVVVTRGILGHINVAGVMIHYEGAIHLRFRTRR